MIVVTGGAGFIGSALVWALNQRGREDILVVDALGEDEKWKNLVKLRFRDYLDRDEFIRRLEEGAFGNAIQGVLHLGACSSTTERDMRFLMENNTRYTLRLAQWCLARNVRLAYASSAATYGDGSLGFSDNHQQLPTLRPMNGYGFSKHLFDLWAQQRGWLDKIAGLKYFNVFGPNEYHKTDMRSVVHKAFEQIRDIGKVRLFKSCNPDYKDGWQLRDFIYVKDVAAMTLYIFDNPKVNGIFNIGTGQARSFYDLAAATFKAMNKKVNIELIDMPLAIRDRYQYFTQADMTKLREIGCQHQCLSLEDAVADYVTGYLQRDDSHLSA